MFSCCSVSAETTTEGSCSVTQGFGSNPESHVSMITPLLCKMALAQAHLAELFGSIPGPDCYHGVGL